MKRFGYRWVGNFCLQHYQMEQQECQLEKSFSCQLELRPTPIPLQLLFVQNLKYQMSFLGENKLFHKGTQNRNNYKNVLSKNGKYSLTKKIREFNLHTAHSSVR